jgi:hypothetical protein
MERNCRRGRLGLLGHSRLRARLGKHYTQVGHVAVLEVGSMVAHGITD